MTLSERLRGMSPAESDAFLANIWKQFAKTDFYEALFVALNDVAHEANNLLLSPNTEDRARAHAAGQVCAVHRLLSTIRMAVNFDPAKATYDPPVGTVIQGGPDTGDDTTQIDNEDF